MSHRSPGPDLSERRIRSVPQSWSWLSLANLPIKHRLPLLIGLWLLGIFVVSTLASYREVRESSLEIGRERLRNLTQQFASISQQSSVSSLNKLVIAANNPVVSAFLQSPLPATKDRAVAVLQQFGPGQDPINLQVELWNSNHELALTIPEGSLPEPPSLEAEFKECSNEPFRAFGALRIINDIVVVPYAVAVRDDSGTLNGYLVKWRRVSVNPSSQQLTDLLGNNAVLYLGNTQGDVWTDLSGVVPRPAFNSGPTPEVTQYIRDGKSVMALGQPIAGTPWTVVVEISDQAFLSQANRFLRRMVLVGVALLAFGIAAAFFLSRSITRPLRALTEVASAISVGDYSRTVDIRQHDELGALASTFNSMIISTRESQGELERKVQERTLQLEAAPWAMLMVNQEGRVTLVNAQAEKLFGYNRSELLEQPIEMLVPERYRSAHPGHRKIFSQNPTARAMGAGRDLYGLHKDGTEIPIEIGISPITIERNEFVLASIIDISERKLAEQTLRRSQEQLTGVIGSAMDAIISVDQEQRIVLFNAAAERMFLFPADEAIGQPLDRFIPERFRASHKGHIQDFGRTHVTKRSMGTLGKLYGLRAEGQEFPIEASISQIESEGRKLYTVILRDITERQRAERAIKEQAQILDLAPVLILDLSGRLIFWNSGAEHMYGWSSQEALGKLSHLLLQTEFPLPLEEIRARVLAQGHWEGELMQTKRNGEHIVVASRWALHKNDQGEPKAILKVNNDITERKQAAKALRESEERLQLAIRATELGTWELNPITAKRQWSEQCKAIFGFPQNEDLNNERIFESIHPDDRKELDEALQRALQPQGGGELHTECRILVGKDKEERWIESRGCTIFANGHAVRLIGTMLDITKRKRAEEALRQSEERLRLGLQAAALGTWDYLFETGDVFWDERGSRNFGFSSVNTTYDAMIERIHPEDREVVDVKVQAALKGKNNGAYKQEFRVIWPDATVHWLASYGRVYFVGAGDSLRPVRYIGLNMDITPRKQSETEIHRLNEELEHRVADRTAQLEAANKELEAFSYSVSHDLRAPLRHIDGFSQALLEDYSDKLDKEGQNYLQEVRSASQEMAQLIEDLLQLAKVTRSEMHREEVNLSELATSVIADLRKTDGRPGVTVKIEEGVSRHGDKRLLRIVLINLLGNSWKFTAGRKQAQITFGETGNNGETYCFVRDNGAGFDMTYGNKLFGAFQRLHSTGEFEGTGIGLATVQRIINRHGGRVWAEGIVDEGAVFYFVLPDLGETGNGEPNDLAG
jgi:PAS domain S-box-containing protein